MPARKSLGVHAGDRRAPRAARPSMRAGSTSIPTRGSPRRRRPRRASARRSPGRRRRRSRSGRRSGWSDVTSPGVSSARSLGDVTLTPAQLGGCILARPSRHGKARDPGPGYRLPMVVLLPCRGPLLGSLDVASLRRPERAACTRVDGLLWALTLPVRGATAWFSFVEAPRRGSFAGPDKVMHAGAYLRDLAQLRPTSGPRSRLSRWRVTPAVPRDRRRDRHRVLRGMTPDAPGRDWDVLTAAAFAIYVSAHEPCHVRGPRCREPITQVTYPPTDSGAADPWS